MAVRCPVSGCPSRKPLYGGSVSHPVLTLIVTPAMLTLPDSMKRRLLSLRGLLPSKTADLPNCLYVAAGLDQADQAPVVIFSCDLINSLSSGKKQTSLTVF